MKRERIYGMMAEFDSAQALVDAAKHTHEAGYNKIDAYSPFPIEGLAEEIGFHRNEVPLVVLIGGIVGGLTGYLMQYWMSAVDYPLNIGGKPYHSWPSFIVITFEMTILFAGISAVFGMLALNGLPMPYHPVFNVPRFSSASKDRVFFRSQVRRGRHARFSARPAAAIDFGGAQLACRVSAKSRSRLLWQRQHCSPPAVSTCKCSRGRIRSPAATSTPISAPSVRRSKARSRGASCTKTLISTRESSAALPATTCRFPSLKKFSSADASATTSIALPVTRESATATASFRHADSLASRRLSTNHAGKRLHWVKSMT